jgi:hypothetical protein
MTKWMIAMLATALTVVWAPGAAAERVAVTITSSPNNATVEWNGQVIGTTPLTRRFDDFFFKAPGWVWSSFLAEEITVRVWKEGFVGKEVRLTSGPFRWANRDWTAVKIYFVITGTLFHVNLEPDAITRMKSEAAPGPVESAGTKAGEAWVLWSRIHFIWFGGATETRWDLYGAVPDAATCENSKRYALRDRTWESGNWVHTADGSKIEALSGDGHLATTHLVCLPATVDPRPR